ncbi:MAG: hypothetical protein U1E65_29465 [Myxococcota bacterium]
MKRILFLLPLAAACGPPDSAEESNAAAILPIEMPMSITLTSQVGCLEASSTDGDGLLVAGPCAYGNPTSEWRLDIDGVLQNVATGSCLNWETIPASPAPVTGAHLGDCNFTTTRWSATPRGELRLGAQCLTPRYSFWSGPSLELAACDGSPAQRWTRALVPDRTPAAAFGFGAMRLAAGQVTPTVPLVRVYVDYTAAPTSTGLAMPISYYENLIFGSSFPSLNGFLLDASSGRFQWADGGAFGPFEDPTDATGCDSAAGIQRILQTYLAERIDLASFDADGDGIVTQGELQFMVIGNCGGRIAGATRPLGCMGGLDSGPSDLVVCPGWVTEIEDQVQFATLAHESMHPLGAIDLYMTATPSEGFTTMSDTIWPIFGAYAQTTVMVDAWHRLQFGWDRPLIPLFSRGVTTIGDVPMDGDRNLSSVLIGSTPSNYVLFEKRTRVGYDSNLRGEGVVAWLVAPGAVPCAMDLTRGACGFHDFSTGSEPMGSVLTAGGQAAVFVTGSPGTGGSMALHWRLNAPMNLVVNQSRSGYTFTLQANTTDPSTGVLIPATVKLGTTVLSASNRKFKYTMSSAQTRPLTLTVSATGYRDATFTLVPPG